MKRVLSWLLAVIITLSCLPATALAAGGTVTASGTCGANVHWTLYSDGELVISGTGPMYDYTATSNGCSPWENTYFADIRTIVIENGVTSIGDCAFRNMSCMTGISIPGSVTSIGSYAFQYCRQMTGVTIPNSVRTIGEGAFSSCSGLKNVVIPDSVTSLGAAAFGYCSDLTEVTLSSGVSCIPGTAFLACSSLSSIVIPASVTAIDGWAFASCSKLSKVYYGGSQSDWARVSIGADNSCLTNAAFEYNYDTEPSGGNSAVPDIPANALYFNGNAYAVYNDGLSWDDAKARCEAMGGHLVTITSAHEQEFVTTLAETGKQSRYWLGATDTETEGKWQWVTGEPWSYTNWLGGQPDNDGNAENWLEIYITVRINNILWRGYWNDVSYDFDRYYRGYICEWELGTDEPEENPSNEQMLQTVKEQLGQIALGPYALKGATINVAGYEFPLIDLEAGITLEFGENLKVVTDPGAKTIKVLLGFDEDASANIQQSANSPTYWSDSYQEVKSMYKDLTGKTVDGTRLWNKFSAMRGKLKTLKASMVVDVEASLAGYLEFRVDGSDLKFSEGGLLASFEADTSLRSYYGPCYVALGVGVGVDGSLVFTNENNRVNPAITVSPNFTLSAGGGIGTQSTYAQIDAYGTLMAEIQSNAATPFRAGADIGVRWEGYIVGKEIFSDSKSFASMELYPNPGDPWAASTLSLLPETDVSDADSYRSLLNAAQPVSRDYLNAPTLFSSRYRGASFAKENTYPLSAPQLVTFGDDTMLLVWIDDDGSKSVENMGSLMYSFFDGEAWSEPAALYEDGTANDMPVVYSDGVYACLVWQKATKVFDHGTETADMLPYFDLYATIFNSESRTFSDSFCVTSQPNTAFEMNPCVFSMEGLLMVSWVENSDNNIYQMSGENTLYRTAFYLEDGTQAEEPNAILTAPNMITDMIITPDALGLSVLENGINTLYSSNGGQVEGVSELGHANGQLFYSDAQGFYLLGGKEKFQQSGIGALGNFKIASNGDTYALFTLVLNEDFTKTLYYSLGESVFDEDFIWSIQWSPFEVYSHNGTNIRDYSPVVLSDGTVCVAFNYVTRDEESQTQRSDLVVDLCTDTVDIQLDYVDFEDEQVETGTVDFNLSVKNNSSSVIDRFEVTIMDETGTTVHTQTVEEPLSAFGRNMLSVSYTLPEDYNNEVYTFQVLPASCTDLDDKNNRVETTVECMYITYDITVENTETGTVTVDKTTAAAGETVTVTATPAEGYRLAAIKVDGVAIEGNTFTVTGNHTVTAEFVELLTFMGSTVEMGNALNMQFAVSTAIATNNPGCYVKMNGPSGEQIAYQDQWNNPGGYYLVPYFGIAAKNMCDDITAVICAADGTEISVVRTDSIRGYVMRMVDKQNDLLKTLMVDMLNYGAEAQKYFDYNEGDLANSQLTAAQLAYGTQTNPELTSEQVKGANYVGSTLDLSSQLMLRIVFKNITRDMHAVATFTNSKGVVQTQEIDGSEFSTVGSYLVADITKAVVADCRCLVNVEVFDAEGNVVASASDSMASYAARQSSGDLYDICMSIMKFADSARAYVNR